MAKIISNLSRVSDLPEAQYLWDGMKAIVAADGSNYIIDTSLLKGKDIVNISGSMSTEPGGQNVIYINFSDGTSEQLIVYNGKDGDKGETGDVGIIGEQGDAAVINYRNTDAYGRGVVGVISIINNSTTDSDSGIWSSLMGKNMNDALYDINETFLTQEQFEHLFENVSWIEAEFTTKNENQESTIFNNDTNNHVIYKKYWTYEEGDIQTYYIKRNDGTYDPVNVSLWDDIYLGEKEGYFPLTSSMTTQDIDIYYLDKQTNEYLPVEKVYTVFKNSTIDENGQVVETEDRRYFGDKVIENYYIPELDASVYAKYSNSMSSWSFVLNAGKDLTWTIYSATKKIVEVEETDDNGNKTTKEQEVYEFTPLTVFYDKKTEKFYIEEYEGEKNYELDLTQSYEFYSKMDSEALITRLNRILVIPSVRYYKRDTATNLYNEVVEGDYEELEDYVIVSKNIETGQTVFERHYSELIYGENVKFVDTITIKDIDLYYSTRTEGAREYYSIQYVYTEKLNENGEVIEGEGTYSVQYNLIPIPAWIIAEFTTLDEDVDALIINANEGLGEEDNTVEDTTVENLDTYVPSTPIDRIVPGKARVFYKKDANGNYKLVNLGKDIIYPEDEYYTMYEPKEGDTDENIYDYVEITGEYAIQNSIVELYEITKDKDGNNIHTLFKGNIVDSNVYYLRKNKYFKIDDIETYLREYTLNLVYGVPQILPVNIYPSSAFREKMTIEYNPEDITFFEDGRIAAVTGDTIYDSKIYIRSDKNPDTVYAIVHVNLLTPASSIKLDEANKYEVYIEDSIEIKYSVLPENATSKKVDWTVANILVEKLDDEGNVEKDKDGNVVYENKDDEPYAGIEETAIDKLKVTGIAAGNVVLTGISDDISKTSVTANVEIITPAEKLYWEQDNIKVEPATYYRLAEIIEHNNRIKDAGDYDEADLWPEEENTVVKTPARYYINVLNGKEYELNPIIEPADVIYTDMVWTSDDETVATVNSENILKGTKVATTKIHGSLKKFPEVKEIVLEVIVNEAITKITVTPAALSLNIDTKKKISATIEPASLANASIKWSSSDENIIKVIDVDPVNNIATIESVGIGTAQIIAQGYDGEEVSPQKGTVETTVTIPAKDIIVDGENISNGIIYVGCDQDTGNNTTDISAVITRDPNYTGEDIYKLGVIWSSADPTIAAVEGKGDKGLEATITGHKIGRTTLVASAADGSGVFGTIIVEVIKLVEKIEFDLSDFEKDESGEKVLMHIGDSFVLVPKFTPESTNEIVIWKSSDDTIAKVKESGIVYALSKGEATITVTSTDGSKKEATCDITIQ